MNQIKFKSVGKLKVICRIQFTTFMYKNKME